jgi:hypothetical protein
LRPKTITLKAGPGNSKILFAIFVVLVLVFASVAIYEAAVIRSTGVSTTTVMVPSVTDQVGTIYADHLLLFGSKNVNAIVSEYETNAFIIYYGTQPAGLDGNYSGAEIGVLYSYWAKHSDYLFIANESQPSMNVHYAHGYVAANVIVNSTFGFRGGSNTLGNFNGTVSAQTIFVPGGVNGTSWLISTETWHFLRFWEQYPPPVFH